MKVELLWWEGCPSYPQALDDLRRVMAEQGMDPESVEVREVDTEAAAERERFVGSPTIRIDGVDVAPVEGELIGLACRVYRFNDGRASPVPDPEDVRAALRRHRDRRAPDFSLPDTDGSEHGPEGVTVVAFTCNHCPYALPGTTASRRRPRLRPRVRLLLSTPTTPTAIRATRSAPCANGSARGPVAAPYLRDEVAGRGPRLRRATTPDVFVLDPERRVRYRGAPDADHSTTRSTRPGCARRWTPSSRAASRRPRRPSPWAARSSGRADRVPGDRPHGRLGVAEVLPAARPAATLAQRVELRDSRWPPPPRARPRHAPPRRRAACPRSAPSHLGLHVHAAQPRGLLACDRHQVRARACAGLSRSRRSPGPRARPARRRRA